MIACKRTLLILLLLMTFCFLGYQLYLIFYPLSLVTDEAQYVHLVDQYNVLKMKRLVLEERYALAKTTSKMMQLANEHKNVSYKQFVINTDYFNNRKLLSPSRTIAFSLHPKMPSQQPIALSLEQAKTFEQLEAYVNHSIPLQPPPLTKSEKSLLEYSANDYTLQLMGVRDINELTHFISENNLQQAHIFHTYYLNKDWYVLVYGLYKNHVEALKAIETLPTNIKDHKPWIRQLSSVQKAIQLYR